MMSTTVQWDYNTWTDLRSLRSLFCCFVCFLACLLTWRAPLTSSHALPTVRSHLCFGFEHEGLKIHASSPLSAFGTVQACPDTVASTPPADQSQACTGRARNHFFFFSFFQVSPGLVPEPGTVALRLIKTSRRLASSVLPVKASRWHLIESERFC